MKKLFRLIPAALLVLGLSLSATSCSDDDDDNKSEEQKEQEQQQQTDTFWDVVGQLTSVDSYTSDYKDKTFEPTIGLPDETNPTVRIVNTNDMASAAQRFASLVGVSSIDAGTTSYEWKDDAVGTLTYQKTNDGKSWATVDVKIPQMPTLSQIIYRSPEQAGTNASKMGTCFYRFGDVVKRVYTDVDDDNKQKTEYWVCVRPAFNPEGKGDSHWITVSPLPKKNIWGFTDSKNRPQSVPVGIGHNKEHMQNLAEMLYAILHPTVWQANVERYPAPGLLTSGLRMFHDFSHADDMVQYHSARYWIHVRQAWDDPKNKISQLLFGSDMTTEALDKEISKNGLNLLTKGYSWWKKTSWNLSLFQYNFKDGIEYESNMHQVTGMTEVKMSMENITNIDIYNQCTLEKPYLVNDQFFGDANPRFIIRHATGKELAGFQPNVYTTMSNAQNGITDVYTYNKYYDRNVSNGSAPEVDDDINDVPLVGYLVGMDGFFYRTVAVCKAKTAGTDPVAIVVALNGKKAVEQGTEYNGLAMGINITENVAWGPTEGCGIDYATTFSQFSNRLDGLATTKQLKEGCGKQHDHVAAKACTNYDNSFTRAQRMARGYSDWFLPSVGQWVMALKAFGFLWDENTGFNYSLNDPLGEHLQKRLAAMGFTNDQYTDNFLKESWTGTPFSTTDVCTFGLRYLPMNNGHSPLHRQATSGMPVRVFIAFKYNGGATKEAGNVDPDPNPDVQESPKAGWILATNGKVYQNVAAARQAKATPMAVVAYYDDMKSVETGTNYHGLAISLKNANYSEAEEMTWVDSHNGSCTSYCSNDKQLSERLDGIEMTKKLHDNHSHYPWAAVNNYGEVNLEGVEGVSSWFLPSSGQWILALKGFGITTFDNTFFNPSAKEAYDMINKHFLVDGLDATPLVGAGNLASLVANNKQGYFTCTEYSEDGAKAEQVYCVYIGQKQGEDLVLQKTSKQSKNFVRPFIAFK